MHWRYFSTDDLGHKTGTLIDPESLGRFYFSWLKRYVSLAHACRKMFWLHSCGNVRKIMEDLIEEVKSNAFHSFQDEIIPLAEFMQKYGRKVTALGGVGMDKLSRMNEESLRNHVREILNKKENDIGV